MDRDAERIYEDRRGRGGNASPSHRSINELCIDAIRTLSLDPVQQAASDHASKPMALAPAVYTLWRCFLRFDPENRIWPNRDRFVLSSGDSALPPDVTASVSVEQASVIGWDRYVGAGGAKIGMQTFGSSAPIKDLLTKYGAAPWMRRIRITAHRAMSSSTLLSRTDS